MQRKSREIEGRSSSTPEPRRGHGLDYWHAGAKISRWSALLAFAWTGEAM
jgi:hypothetical protein